MTTENTTLAERVATLEEAYQHLATKEDIADLKILIANGDARNAENIARLETSMTENIARLETSMASRDARNAENIARYRKSRPLRAARRPE